MASQLASRRATFLAAALVAGLATWLTPATAGLAATPTFGPGFPPPPPEPERGFTVDLGSLMGVAIVLLVVLGIFAVLWQMARTVAGLDGDGEEPVGTATAASTPSLGRSRSGWLRLAIALGALGLGVVAGREIAFQQSLGGLGGTLAATLLALGIGALAASLGLVGLLALGLRGGRPTTGIMFLLVTAGCLAIGALAGDVSAGATGGTYRQPVSLEASGSTEASLLEARFSATPGGAAVCRSVADGEEVESVTGLDLGAIDGATLRGTVSIPHVDSVPATLELWIDGADLPEGAVQPFWDGRGAIEAIGPSGAFGTVRFERVPRSAVQEEQGVNESPDGWPEAISGEISWRCDAWAGGSS